MAKPQPPPLWQSLLGVADPTGPVANDLNKGLQQAGTSLGGLVPDIGTAITNAFKGLAGPITTWLSVKEASLLNTLNQLFNTAIYGGLALAGARAAVGSRLDVLIQVSLEDQDASSSAYQAANRTKPGWPAR